MEIYLIEQVFTTIPINRRRIGIEETSHAVEETKILVLFNLNFKIYLCYCIDFVTFDRLHLWLSYIYNLSMSPQIIIVLLI